MNRVGSSMAGVALAFAVLDIDDSASALGWVLAASSGPTSKPVAHSVDIALYDTFASGQGNSSTVALLLANPRVSKVAVYTWNFQPWLARETMATGVCGYLSKSLSAA